MVRRHPPALTNLDPQNPAALDVALAGVSARGATGHLITAPAVDSHNDFDHPQAVAPVDYAVRASGGELRFDPPPKSIVVRVE